MLRGTGNFDAIILGYQITYPSYTDRNARMPPGCLPFLLQDAGRLASLLNGFERWREKV